jgi:hypothetical protein
MHHSEMHDLALIEHVAEHSVECVATKAMQDRGFIPFHSDVESIILAIRCLARRCLIVELIEIQYSLCDHSICVVQSP